MADEPVPDNRFAWADQVLENQTARIRDHQTPVARDHFMVAMAQAVALTGIGHELRAIRMMLEEAARDG